MRAVVLGGAGERAFCAGSDVKEFEGLAGRVAQGKLLYEKYVYRKLAELPVPTIAAIEGDALGGGLELALCCDLRVASARARLGMPEVRLGVMPGSGGTQRLPAVVGPARAKELILVGDLIDAQRPSGSASSTASSPPARPGRPRSSSARRSPSAARWRSARPSA